MLTKPLILYTKLRFCSSSSVVKKYFHLKCSLPQQLTSNGTLVIPIRFIGSTTAEKDPPRKKVDLDFPERKITVFTCENVYDKWKKESRVFKLPESGVHAEISYIDTLDFFEKNGSQPSKTILCIHGIPGNYGVFSYLIKDLTNEGVRVVVPTFPATLYLPGKHKNELFRHSVEEKTQVFKDFLKALNISKLDAVIAHSSAIYPALRLVLDPELGVKCQVLFNTGGHKKTVTMRPFWIVWTCSWLYLTPIGRILVQKTGKFIMRYIMRTPIKDDNFDGIMLLAITMIFSEYWNAKAQFLEIAERKIPTLYCFSEDDKVVERKLTYEVVSLLGASIENITYYDEEAKLEVKGKDLPWLKLISFKEGSHYVFRKYPEICNKEVIELLRKVKSSCRSG